MPETQAKSGGRGASATPGGAGKQDGAAANGRDAGRPAGPADPPSPPKFTRAPGMAPPPGEPTADGDGSSDAKRPGGPAVAKGSATVPIVTKGKGAAPGSTSGRVTPPPSNPATAPQRPVGSTSGSVSAPTQAGGKQQRPGQPQQQGQGQGQGQGQAAGSAAVGAARVSEAVRSARSTVSSA